MNINRYRVRNGDRSALARIETDDTGPYKNKDKAEKALDDGLDKLDKLQELLYASDRYSLLLIFQGMDAAGKDSAITHVLSGTNPQGVTVHAFKRPSDEELAHDFLWRAVLALPARGRIGIFNRSYYEDVVVVRVHQDLIGARKLPADRVTKRIWRDRFEDIENFERHLDRNATIVCKFYMHVSREKQRDRLLTRLDTPSKRWKFSMADLAERDNWSRYRSAYVDAIAATSHAHAPWYVIPSDHKWFAHLLIAEIIATTLDGLDLSLPAPGIKGKKEIDEARALLTQK